ncbi:MAG: BrnT family toxin [Methanosarcinales archaeon]|nr:BrnT family toxin [Methanosarcinales archaeon]
MRIRRLHWDEYNIFHIACHGITTEDVEYVCYGGHVARKARDRYLVYGKTKGGRYILVVLGKSEDSFMPITARDMNESEKKVYRRMVR